MGYVIVKKSPKPSDHRRFHIRRLLIHASAFNLGLALRKLAECGTPKVLQGRSDSFFLGQRTFHTFSPTEADRSKIEIAQSLTPNFQSSLSPQKQATPPSSARLPKPHKQLAKVPQRTCVAYLQGSIMPEC